jgi:RHS repeat-associated protein
VGQTATDSGWWSRPTTAANVGYIPNNLNQYTTVGAVTPTYDGNGNLRFDGTFTGGALQAWYAFGLGSDAVLNRMNVAASSRQTMIPDIQGSIIGTLDSGGTLAKAGVQPYGENPTVTTGSFRYTGRRIDPETGGSASQPSGLYYYRARMYSPPWGRFLQPDPIGHAGGGNLYAYVGNDPLNPVDPGGLINNCYNAARNPSCRGSASRVSNQGIRLEVHRWKPGAARLGSSSDVTAMSMVSG